jgi:hypothetical protein
MTNLAAKKRILDTAGYRYSFDRELYFNREVKKAFSVEFVEDKPEAELERRISEETLGTDWHFFFNNPPSDAIKRELANALR